MAGHWHINLLSIISKQDSMSSQKTD